MKPVETVQAQGLLRNKKYYVKATNGACANCDYGKLGCCQPGLQFLACDFRSSLASARQVKSLLAMGIFTQPSKYGVRIRGRVVDAVKHFDRYEACVFWTNEGCRLAHDVRPRVCRWHTCYRIKKNYAVFNQENAYLDNYEYLKGAVVRMYERFFPMGVSVFLSEEEYNSLDWDSILTTLQGFS